MSETLHIKVEPQLSGLDQIASEIKSMGQREGWPDAMAYRVHLALEELVLNVINHGYGDTDLAARRIEVTLDSGPESLSIHLLDNGRAFDPLSDAPEPDIGGQIEERAIGGLGVHLVRTLMDEMHYRRENGENHLTLIALRQE